MAKPTEVTRHAFRFLIDDFGYRLRQATDDARESYVTFESDTTVVSVAIELPAAVLVTVLHRPTGDSFALPVLVRDAAPDEVNVLQSRGEPLAHVLRVQARMLREYGSDVLTGDDARFARLRRTRADLVRERNKASFGTSTGETPRFRTRPSLEQLFADASNEGVRVARVYQAVWDYGFSRKELASFLERTEQEIEEMLARWENP